MAIQENNSGNNMVLIIIFINTYDYFFCFFPNCYFIHSHFPNHFKYKGLCDKKFLIKKDSDEGPYLVNKGS